MSEIRGRCDCCGYGPTWIQEYDRQDLTVGTTYTACRLCARTLNHRAYIYPKIYHGQIETMRTICYVGNVILSSLEGREP